MGDLFSQFIQTLASCQRSFGVAMKQDRRGSHCSSFQGLSLKCIGPFLRNTACVLKDQFALVIEFDQGAQVSNGIADG